jgi:hypothetical protein
MQFAVADIKVCSDGNVDSDGYGFDASNFMLTDTEARTYEFWNVQVGAPLAQPSGLGQRAGQTAEGLLQAWLVNLRASARN